MANTPRDPAWRDKNKIGATMRRVYDHALGKTNMTPTQLRAAEIYLRKTVPDLHRTTHVGDLQQPIVTKSVADEGDLSIIKHFIKNNPQLIGATNAPTSNSNPSASKQINGRVTSNGNKHGGGKPKGRK